MVEYEVHYQDAHYDYLTRRADSRAALQLGNLPSTPKTTVVVTRYDPDGQHADDGPIVVDEWSYDAAGNYRPGPWTGRCECGAEPVDTTRRWEVEPAVEYDHDATAPGYDYTGAEWDEPVCYPITLDRSGRAPYRAHLLRMARWEQDGRGLAEQLLSRWQATESEIMEEAEEDIADWVRRGRAAAKDGGTLRNPSESVRRLLADRGRR